MSTLVAYYSRAGQNYGNGGVIDLPKGNTEVLAEAIAADLGADLFKIETVEPYPTDYFATTDQAKRELRENARPAIQGPLPNMEGVDAIVLGYPNWWGTMPMAVKTFLDGCDLTGVTIAPLCTNEGSGLGNSVSDLRRTYPAANVVEGLSVRGTDAARSTGRAISWAKKALA
ncbi:MAG: NAD(P)H-dependent oxidoreductase [Atopobiaceae bacterium]|nr:NAD(P)H-dependent oxidoreductase [Atopobiaceae bacterium]